MTRPFIAPTLALAALLAAGCGGGAGPAPPPAPTATTAPTPPAVSAGAPMGRTLSDLEWSLVGDQVQAIRAGVQPVSAEALGICRTEDGTTCSAFVGTETGPLEPGEYLFYAELSVPDAGPPDTWKVTFETRCTVQGSASPAPGGASPAPGGASPAPGVSESIQSKEYGLTHSGAEHGYRLRLRRFTSPLSGGTRTCSWTLAASAPQSGPSWSGSWTVPAEET